MKFFKLVKKINILHNDKKGIALFMVMSTVSVLALLATEFIYVAQINQKMAYESVDQVRAHYLAKSALKVSLLRLKIYQQIRDNDFIKKSGLPVDEIWKFPFVYPIPSLPGMTRSQRDEIEKFKNNSNLEGSFTALIDSESSKFNLNLLLAHYKPEFKKPDDKNPNPNQNPSPNPNTPQPPSASTPPGSPNPNDPNNPNNPNDKKNEFDPEEARKYFSEFLASIFNQKKEEDVDFLDKYNNFELQPLIENIFAWIDYSYESQFFSNDKEITPKKAPLFDLSELHLIPLMEDELYNLFMPYLTTGVGRDINVNTINENLLRAIFPVFTEEQAKKLIEERENPLLRGRFKSEDDFYKVIQPLLGWDDKTLEDEKGKFQIRNIRFITEESTFKVTISSTSNLATQNIEAIVSFVDTKKQNTPPSGQSPGAQPVNPAQPQGQSRENPSFQNSKSGIKIDRIRVL